MNYGEIKNNDIANGLGVRVSLFVSGCRHCCKNCFNSQTWSFNYGTPFTTETEDYIIKAMEPDYISGLSLLGGEPFEPENQPALINLLKRVKSVYPNKNIWCYTGFLFDSELLGQSRANGQHTLELLKLIDVLVDGRFVEELKDITLKFRGSSNQRIINVKESLEQNKVVLVEELI
ncbi:MAG: anaerobic ribonucleoside-triphosphate reductase activating protein [Clostridia bacterium]|nr:anaerobic ribonucleoside-triphosphate reductase activating protein [Clostridia bacterium]